MIKGIFTLALGIFGTFGAIYVYAALQYPNLGSETLRQGCMLKEKGRMIVPFCDGARVAHEQAYERTQK
jgi:hypothetical protein